MSSYPCPMGPECLENINEFINSIYKAKIVYTSRSNLSSTTLGIPPWVCVHAYIK